MAEIAFEVQFVVSMARTFGVAVVRERVPVVVEDRHSECTKECFVGHIGRIELKHSVVVRRSFVVAAFGQEWLVVRLLADTRAPFVHNRPVADIGQHSCSVKAMLETLVVAVAVLAA